jgi:hypothetical protein
MLSKWATLGVGVRSVYFEYFYLIRISSALSLYLPNLNFVFSITSLAHCPGLRQLLAAFVKD